jgi:hypothetical protein
MTVRDPEVVDLLRDEPELLAIADAVATTQRVPGRAPVWRRRLVPRVAALAVAVVAVIAVVLLAPDRVGHHGVIARALAAIGNGRVMHLKLLTPSGRVFVNLQTGRRAAEMYRTEIWYDRDAKRLHYLMRAQGAVADFVWPDDKQPGMTLQGRADPAFVALWSGYRDALAKGKAKLEGKGRVDGRAVYWLRFESVQPGVPGTEVAIARNTYKPVVFREHYSHARHADERVLVAESIAYSPSDFRRQGPNLFALSGSSGSGGSTMSLPLPRHPRVKPPWLTAGSRAAGLPLGSVTAYTATSSGRTIRGVELTYGKLDVHGTPGRRAVTIDELPRPDDPMQWKSTSPHSVVIERGEVGDAHGNRPEWTGYLRKRGLYVTIKTTVGERTLVAVARALRPA